MAARSGKDNRIIMIDKAMREAVAAGIASGLSAADAYAVLGVNLVDAVLQRIESGESQAEIARSLRIDAGDLSRMLNADEATAQRSARAREASAEAWLDRGLAVVESALDKSGVVDASAAKTYAQECARRAAIRNPRYRDHQKIDADVNLRHVRVRDFTGRGDPDAPAGDA